MQTFKLFICENYSAEFCWASREGGIENIAVIPFPCMCQDKNAKPAVTELLRETVAAGEQGTILCGNHCEILSLLPEGSKFAIKSAEFCAAPLAGDGLLSFISSRGGYIVTLGWLQHWQQRLADQGFDRATARLFFKDFCKELIFLDAGIEPQAENMLRELSEYLDIPFAVVELRQDTLLVLLQSLICDWQLQRTDRSNLAKLNALQVSAAEYAAILDVMGKIAGANSRREAIEKIKEIFTTVLGARQFRFWDSELSSTEMSHETQQFFGESVRTYMLDKEANRFTVKIQSHDRVFGAAEVGQFLFPEQVDRYLNFAVAIAPVCGLALSNIENYERLLQSEQNLQYLSFHDKLTGLHNRNFLATMFDNEEPWVGSTVFMFDLDGLKRVNDTYGHLEGDLLISGAAQALRECFRETDVVARIGGDEFVVIARDCDQDCAGMLAARLGEKIAEHNRANAKKYLDIELSMGYTHTAPEGETLEAAMQRADALMYEHKRSKA